MLEKTEGAINNEHRHWAHKTKNEDKQNKQKPVVKPGSHEGWAVPASYKTATMLLI